MLIRPRDPARPIPAAFVHTLAWRLFDMDTPFLNVAYAARLVGDLDEAALARALDTLVARHEALRTAIELGGSGPRAMPIAQRVHPPSPVALARRELSANTDVAIAEAVRAEFLRPFDTRQVPLLRPSLLKLGPKERVLVVVTTHAAWDRASAGIFLSELSTLYGKYLHGAAPSLKPLSFQWADYTLWQHDWFSGARREASVQAWQAQLAPALELRLDRARPTGRCYFDAQERVLPLTAELAATLRSMAKEAKTTPFTVLLATYRTLFHDWANPEGGTVGVVSSNRVLPGTDALIGAFVHPLAVRMTPSNGMSFADVLSTIRRTVQTTSGLQGFPPTEAIADERDLHEDPPWRILFNYAPVGAPLHLDGLTIDPCPPRRPQVRWDLEVNIFVKPDQSMSIVHRYNAEVFESHTIERRGQQLIAILERAARQPTLPVTQLVGTSI